MFVLLYNAKFLNKFKVDALKINKITKLTVQILWNLQNHPIFHSQERWVNLVRRRECLVALSFLFFVFTVQGTLCYPLKMVYFSLLFTVQLNYSCYSSYAVFHISSWPLSVFFRLVLFCYWKFCAWALGLVYIQWSWSTYFIPNHWMSQTCA